MPAVVIGAGIIAAATIGTQAVGAHQEKKQQDKLLQFQLDQTAKAEAKAAQADVLANQAAEDKIRKRRLAQTKTILTTPLGVLSDPLIGQKTLTLG